MGWPGNIVRKVPTPGVSPEIPQTIISFGYKDVSYSQDQ